LIKKHFYISLEQILNLSRVHKTN